MKSKRNITLLVLIILIGTIFASKYSSSFPIGTYSYLGNNNYVYDNREFFKWCPGIIIAYKLLQEFLEL